MQRIRKMIEVSNFLYMYKYGLLRSPWVVLRLRRGRGRIWRE
jgi:hypothetical protein